MLRLSVCIDMVLADLPLEERMYAVSNAGFGAYEFWDFPSKDWKCLNGLRRSLGLCTAAFILEPRGVLVHGIEPSVLIEGLYNSIAVAHELDCKNLILLAGRAHNMSRVGRENVIAGLKRMAPIVEDEQITLLLEPLNTLVDHPGFFLSSSKEALDIVRDVGSPNIKVLFDIYHQQISEGNLIANISAGLGSIGHFHAADVPGRHEPGTGEINYQNVLRAIEQAGYTGYVGLEYKPLADPSISLHSVKTLLQMATGESPARMRDALLGA